MVGPQENPMKAAAVSSRTEGIQWGEVEARRIEIPNAEPMDDWKSAEKANPCEFDSS